MLNKDKMAEYINPNTGEAWIDERISRKVRRLGLMKYGRNPLYKFFDRAGFINAHFNKGRPFVITWVPSSVRLYCRHYEDVYGVSDIFGIEEILTLFTNVKGMESFRIFLIPYLLTGYDIPSKLEEDPEPLVPFTAKTMELMKEIEDEPVWPAWMRG